MRLEQLHPFHMYSVLLLENKIRYRSSDNRCTWCQCFMALALSTSVSMTSEGEGTDPSATSDNVMTIFTSFQQTFNTEQDIREVGMVQYAAYKKKNHSSTSSLYAGLVVCMEASYSLFLFCCRVSVQLCVIWSRLHVVSTPLCRASTTQELMKVSPMHFDHKIGLRSLSIILNIIMVPQ